MKEKPPQFLHFFGAIPRCLYIVILSILDHRPSRVVANLSGDEDYSRLGLCNSDLENNYQLLDEEELDSKVKN